MGKSLLVFALGIGFLLIPFSIRAEVYKWIDDKGNVHFTDEYSTIPEKYIPSTKIQNLPKESPRPSIDEKLNPAVAPKSSEPLALETPTPRLFSGTISSVGSEIIVVRDEEKEMAFSISNNSIIKTENGEPIALDKLKNGMQATVEYIIENKTFRLLSIKVNFMRKGFGEIQRKRQKQQQGTK